MDFKLSDRPLLKGVCAPLPLPLDSAGNFDAAAQERLLEWVIQGGQGVHAVLSASGSGLDAFLRRQANEACHFSSSKAEHWAGVSAKTVEGLLQNLEHALKLGVSTAVLDPLAVEDSPDPVSLFHRHIQPFFEKHGKGLPILIEDSLTDSRIKTRDLKQLARLEILRGVCVTAPPSVVGNYLKGARHYKARHEFGVFLGNAELIFSLFKPAGSMLGGLQERWQRLWLGAELPHGIAPLSANLFPRAWRQAWAAALVGDTQRMLAFEEAFKNLAFPFDPQACVRAALAEEGVLSSDRGLPGQLCLNDAERAEWLFEYFSTKKELSKLLKGPAPELPAAKAEPVASTIQSWEILGMGGVILDEFRRVPEIIGAEAKAKIQGPVERLAGGGQLNQMTWVASLGFKSAIVGMLGADADGDWLRGELRSHGIEDAYLKPSKLPTDISRIFVDAKGGRAIYLEPGAATATRAEDIAPCEAVISKAKLLSMEISVLPLEALLQAMDLAHKHQVPVAIDLDIPASQVAGKQGLGTAAQLQRLLKEADYLKTSLGFAKALAPKVKPAGLALALHKKYGKKKGNWVVLTDGSKGCTLSDGLRSIKVPAIKGLKVVDSTGCGDAFMAGMLVATRLGLSLKEMASLANACGAACITSLGAAAGPNGRSLLNEIYKGPGLALAPVTALAAGTQGQGTAFAAKALKELQKFSSKISSASLAAARQTIRQAESSGKRLHVTGVGKPEYVAGYIASSFSSTGTPAFFLHATEAGHGASGQVAPGDVVIAISNSGETEELKSAVSTVKKNGALVIGVSGKEASWLARQSDVFLFAGVDHEGDALNMAPRASVLAELLVLSALGVELQQEKEFSAEDFRSFHPGGALGRRN